MYDELIASLRICIKCSSCKGCKFGEEVDESDLISGELAEPDCMGRLMAEAADAIEELSKENESLGKDLTSAVEMLKKKRKPQWIPCSERLPKENEDVLVYLWDRQVPYLACVDTEGRWETNDFFIDIENKPKAWIPLPKPYEPPKEE